MKHNEDLNLKQEFKGKNGRYLRIGVHKVTREVRRISPDNWSEDAKSKFYTKFPNFRCC